MSDTTADPAKLAAVLQTEGKNAPKTLCFNLKNQLKDEGFAKAFAEEGGMDGLMGVAAQATGNVQTYALIALRVAISHSSGAEGILRKEELLQQLVELLESPLLPVAKQVAEILGVLSCSAPSSWRRIHKAVKKDAEAKGKKPYASLIQSIVANDLDLQVNAITLMNNLLSAAPERMRKFLNVWRDLGAEDKLKTVAQTSKYEALIAQVQQYQKKLLAVFPEAAHLIDDPSPQPAASPATAMSRTRRGTITIAKKVAAVGTLRKRDKEGDAKSTKKDAQEKDDEHSGETTVTAKTDDEEKEKEKEKEREKEKGTVGEEEQNDEAKEKEKEKEKQKKKLKDKLKAKKAREADAEIEYQRTSTDEKLRAYENQQPLIRLLKYELKRQEAAINEALAHGAHINAYAPLKRYVERVDDMSAEMPVELSSLLTPSTSSSLDEVKQMREKMESLAGQVEKLKEVGKALVSKKESEIQTLKKEIAELNEDKNHHKKEMEGLRRELQRKEEMAEHAEERNKRGSVALESKRSRKDSPNLTPPLASPPSGLASSASAITTKEAEDLRGEVERLKRELGETRAENEALQKAEKQRAANAALLVKEMKAEEKHYASPSEMIDDFQKMKEQVMKLQMLKEQVIKEMRQIKKTAFVGFPEFGEKLGGIDGLEMKQVQEELERERKEKEAAQAEVLLLKTKISELGSPEEVEELRKRNAELVQTNQKVTKENTALRVSMLEARMKGKQDAKQAPAKSNEDVERLETELARKEREVEEEREGKENALTQLKAMMEVLKTKYYAELETKKKTESEMATLRERLEQRDAEQQQRTRKEDKKGKKSAQELEDALKNSKRKVKELEEEKARWTKERGEIEMRLDESQKNENTSTNAAFSLNEQVAKLKAELDELRAERQQTTLQDKVARLEKEKKDLQDQFGKELNELRGQTSALYEADIQKLKEEVTRLQREKQMACQLLVSSNDKLKKMEVLLDTCKKDVGNRGN